MNPKEMAFDNWKAALPYLRMFKRLKDYGLSETPDTIWDKLPQDSKHYWIAKAAQ